MSSVGKFQWKTQKTEEKKYYTGAFQHDIPNFNEILICRVLKITKRDVQKSMKMLHSKKKILNKPQAIYEFFIMTDYIETQTKTLKDSWLILQKLQGDWKMT